MADFFSFMKEFTPGAAGVWTLVVMGLVAWWQGLPKLIEAIANRQSKIEERLGHEMDAMSKRWEERLKIADDQHQACVNGQEQLRVRITQQDVVIATQNETIANLNKANADLRDKMSVQDVVNKQLQMSLAAKIGDEYSKIGKALDKLRSVQ